MRRETCLKPIFIYFAIFFFCSSYALAGTWKTLDIPNLSPSLPEWFQEGAVGISGGTVVGTCVANQADQGFIYNSSGCRLISMPGAPYTRAYGIDGSNVVGTSSWGNAATSGFIYNTSSSSWTTLPNMPGSIGTEAYAIDGGNVVGMSINPDGTYGKSFIYNGTNWKVLDNPGWYYLEMYGISGNKVVGSFSDMSTVHGCLYDGSSWTTLDMPGAYSTSAFGIDGDNIVGVYGNSSGYYGFLYDGSTWTTLQKPGAWWTEATSIDGDNISGLCWDNTGVHAFVYTIPEPATLLLLTLGGLFLRKRK